MKGFPQGFVLHQVQVNVLHRGAAGRAGRKVLTLAPNLALEIIGLALRKAHLVK